MIKFKTYSEIKQGQEIGGFFLYSPDELLEDAREKSCLAVYGGFAVYNLKGQGMVAEKAPEGIGEDSIGEGGLYFSDLEGNIEGYFTINSDPGVYRTAWFKTREGAERFLEKYGKVNPSGECLGLEFPQTLLFNE